ncbi:MAG TPA: secretin N-terminal domain-containing protein [Candidatus Baltobacteraceae bacterium]|nr:secretin N-terminal domain-containing protein [Candidatus Baltobacteraceae bacterium]
MRTLAATLLALMMLCGATNATAGLVTIDVHDVEIGDVVALLAAESGVNLVTDASVKPERITLHLHDVTFDAALAAIAAAHGLTVRREGTILIVAAAQTLSRDGDTAVIALRHAQPEDVAKEISDALPQGTVIVPDKRTGSVIVEGDANTTNRARRLVGLLDGPRFSQTAGRQTKSYRLRYLKPDDVVTKLKVTTPDGSFLADEEQNAVLVTGGERVQASAQSLIASLDVASPQVLFEVKVADITPVNDSSNVGFEFGGLDLTGQPLAGAAEYAFTGGTIPVNVRLNLLVSKGHAQILATPKLVTINNKEADLMIGETYPIVYSTSVLGGQNVQYVDIGVHLRLTPTIGTDGSVTAELHPEYSELIGFTSTGYPIVANRKIDSTLRVADNQTIVLGGLMRETSNETLEKVPGLADIPIIGKLFQNRSSNHERDEIVFLITPHVIYPGGSSRAKP